jgi:hypothetical protein
MSRVPIDRFVLHHNSPESALFKPKPGIETRLVMQHKGASA